MSMILTVKTGAEQYANRVQTSDLYIVLSGDKVVHVTEFDTYTPHEKIVCGPDGIFGFWEVGHIILEPGVRVFGLFTRKIIIHHPHTRTKANHQRIQCMFEVRDSNKNGCYPLHYWGYNGGNEVSHMVSGPVSLLDEKKEEYDLNTPLSKLPF